jgi:hypothetical protein
MNLPGGYGAPYRENCGSGENCFLGSPYQHLKDGDESVECYVFDQMVQDPANPSGSKAPYERFSDVSGECTVGYHEYFPQCDNWYRSDLTGATQQYFNLTSPQPVHFSRNGNADMKVCRKRGTKTVAAKRQWHGQFGFLHGVKAAFIYCGDSNNFCNYSPYQFFQPNPDRTKYCHQEGTISFVGDGNSWSASKSADINPMSGIKTTSYSTNFPTSGEFSGVESFIWNKLQQSFDEWKDYFMNPNSADIQNPLGFTLTCQTSGWTWNVNDDSGTYYKAWWDSLGTGSFNMESGDSHGPLWQESFIIRDTSVTYTATLTNYDDDPPSTVTYGGVLNLTSANLDSTVYTDIVALLSLYLLNDDRLYPWRTDSLPQICPLVSRNEVPANVAPTFEGTGWTDTNATLCDGAVLGAPMPAGYEGFWDSRRQDTRFGCPESLEGVASPSIDIYGWGGVRDVAATPANLNTKLGCQVPLNSTQWTDLSDAISFRPQAFIKYADKTIFNDPNCSTENGITSNGALFAVKFATIKEQFPSQNLARPGGADKFAYVERDVNGATNVFGATNVSGHGAGSTWTLTDYLGNPSPAITDTTGYWGGKSVNGFYSIASYSGGVVTLGAKKFNLPSDWASASGDDGVCFGKLRWPTAPGIIGRVAIESVTDITTARQITLGAPLMTLGLDLTASEMVDICDKVMTVLASNVAVTKILTWAASTDYTVGQIIVDGNGALQTCSVAGTSDASAPTWAVSSNTIDGGVTWTFTKTGSFAADENFTVPTDLTTIAGAAWIVPHLLADGATPGTSYYWNDQFSKNDFVAMTWLFNNRLFQETTRINAAIADCAVVFAGGCACAGLGSVQTVPPSPIGTFTKVQGCLPFSQCDPQVICFSPNGETFPNGITYDFPTDFPLDEVYGSLWQGEVVMAVGDPLYQSPHVPIGRTTAWTMDDGSCVYSFPHAPMVEPLTILPSDAPALPAGITFDFVDVAPLAVIGVSFAAGSLNSVDNELGFRLKIEASACNESCAWSALYANYYSVICP